ncbi:MAG TPA: FAD-binding oxidoreductase [Acidimicrobiales bacterium]|jgi:FAD/FMN-containing dehydrogenase|nr:FAD-binding oxidoreductase [Acidimicrobiales bacterium]
MDRRGFLKTGSVALGGAALAGCATSHGSAGPTTSSTTSSPSSPSSTGTTSGPPPWSTLAGTLSGSLVLPGDGTYAAQSLLFNELLTSQPAAIALCATPTDVQRCVGFARAHGVPLAARSGGHSYAGYSSGPGLMVDVSALNRITLGGGQQAVVGAGTRLIDLYSTLGAANVLLPGGSCPTVGIAGLALGGGIGVFGRAYGLTCDNIASLDVVTADGSLRTCSPHSHADLYWASRGGGGGNFGIVTSFTFTTHPMPDVNLFTLEWNWSEAGAVLDAWLTFIPAAPPPLWANCQLASNGTGSGVNVKVTGVFAGSTAACASALTPLLSAVGAAPTYRFVGPEDYMRAMLIEAGCENLTVPQCHLPAQNPAGTRTRTAFVAKSTYVNAPLPAAGTAAVISAVEALEVPAAGGGVVFDGYGGTISTLGSGDTAFVHRDAIACAQYSVNFNSAAGADLGGARDWLAHTQSTFAPYAEGSYQNYIDPTLTDWAQAYYGANLPRLRQVKAVYDPDDTFHFAQSIPLPI